MSSGSRGAEIQRAICRLAVAVLTALLVGCGFREPFSYVKVSGKVTYEDGSVIPCRELRLYFLPKAPPLDAKTHPRPAAAAADPKTGHFSEVTSHTFGDGLVPGEHMVLVEALGSTSLEKLPAIEPDYADATRTPLVVNTKDAPFALKVRKPRGSRP